MPYEIQILFGKSEIAKYQLGEELTASEKEINLKSFSFEEKNEAKAFLKGVNEGIGWTECCLVKNASNMTREDFMEFFRDDDKLQTLTADDRIEIFSQILLGQSDFTKELLESIFQDYDVTEIAVVERIKK
ncbi:MAG: hypothetical protein PHP42_12185 [Bacteroidota bacterium]|nr:hypothetical protein [Bacteroidota bacterium]